jgi:hypothetical protein
MKSPKPDRVAQAYKLPDRIVLHSQARAPSWLYVACEPYLTLSPNAPPDEIGRAVLTVLRDYRAEVPEPNNFKEVTAAFLRGVGAKSHKQLQQTSINCGILERPGRLDFEPTHNGGTSGDSKGFQPISGTRFGIALDASPAEIGAALLKGFDLCTTIYCPGA